MPNSIQQLNDRTVCATISGVLGMEDVAAMQAAVRAMIAKVGQINAMIILQDLTNFAPGADLGNLEFYAEHANNIIKMALVGDLKWKARALVFTGAGIRKTRVEFFEMSSFGKARDWVTAE